ncbi:TolC family protein [Pontibacter sp. MBLB2868]|uniref:TolC family protein n=1 Tax=Pontibacter sp. MBLB2868 TaxID=3451555 RepID=UPI003F750110
MNLKISNYRLQLVPERTFLWLKNAVMLALMLAISGAAAAQQPVSLSLQEAIDLGLKNSVSLKLSQSKVSEAIARYNQVKDKSLPTASASYTYNHAEIPTTTFQISDEGQAFHLPRHADAFIGTVALKEVIFSGNRMRYAQESTNMLAHIAQLDTERDKEEIAYTITSAYFNLYKLQQSKRVVAQNLEDVDRQIKKAQRYFDQGIVTKNDVLRFQLQRSDVELAGVDLETNRKIVVYNLDLLLGLPQGTDLEVQEQPVLAEHLAPLTTYVDSALVNRPEIRALGLKSMVAENNIKSVRAEKLPTVLVGADAYMINPSGTILPTKNGFVAPLTAGATVAWNIDQLWLSKNKESEAKIQKAQVELNKNLTVDQVKSEVNESYQNYQRALQRVQILETAIHQATENDRMLESQYQNQIATATDRIDAETQLFQAMVNLELAKADAGIAYQKLLKSTGNLTKE